VSLTEIERVARTCRSVELAAAAVHEDQWVQTLILYVTPLEADIPSVVMALHQELPPQMLPHHTVRLASLPRTLKGAINRLELQAMPPPESPARPRRDEPSEWSATGAGREVSMRGMVQSAPDSRWRCYGEAHRSCHAFPRVSGISRYDLMGSKGDAKGRAEDGTDGKADGADRVPAASATVEPPPSLDDGDDYWAAFEGMLAEETEVPVGSGSRGTAGARAATESWAKEEEVTCGTLSPVGPTPAEVTEVTGVSEHHCTYDVPSLDPVDTGEPEAGTPGLLIEHEEEEQVVLPDPIMDRPVMRELVKARGIHFWSLLIKDAFELVAYPEPEGPTMLSMGTVRQAKSAERSETRALCPPA